MSLVPEPRPVRRRQLHRLLLVVLPLALLGAGCSSSGDRTASTGASGSAGSTIPGSTPGAATGTITVSAAASLTAPFKAIGEGFKQANPGVTAVRFNFDSSGTLATQIIGGAPSDGFASADEASMAKLTDANLVAGRPQVFARNQLTIVVKQGNPRNVEALADLTRAGTVSLCGSDVPCGRYADQILQAAGVTIPADAVTRGQNVKATLAAVADGDADAGIVYVTDVTGDKVQAVAIPAAQNAVVTYPIASLQASTNPATMDAFIAYLLGPAGQATLQAAGFLPPA